MRGLPATGRDLAGRGYSDDTLRGKARTGDPAGVKGGKREEEGPPEPELIDGAPPNTQAAAKREPLRVAADDHLADEYAPPSPGCHRTFRLSAAGNGSWGGCPTRRSAREPRGAV